MLRIKNTDNSAVFEGGDTIINKNRINLDEYQIVKKYQAGIVLQAREVKSIYLHSCSLQGSYCKIRDKILVWTKGYIKASEYRDRDLLVNKKERDFIQGYLKTGYVLLPVSIFKYNNLIKLKLILAKYIKTLKRKREKLREKAIKSEIRYATK